MRKGSNFILCLWLSRYLAPFVEKTILSPLNYFGTLVKNQLTVNWGFSSRLYLLNFYWMLLLLLLISHFSRVQLCNPIDGSPPGSSVPGILQARTLEWVAISCSHAWKWKVKVKSLSRVRLSATPWTVAYQAPPSMGFSRQEYWSEVPLPSPFLFLVRYNISYYYIYI